MSQELKINCDQCGKQLNIDDPYPHNYGIHVSNWDYGVNTGESVYAITQYPKLRKDLDFCDIQCLENWAKGE